MALTPETRKEANELIKHFLVPFDLEEEAKSIRDRLPQLPEPFRIVAEVFLDRLNATIRTTAAPFLFASSAAQNRHHQRISTAERIRAGLIDKEPGESDQEYESRQNSTADEIARMKMESFCKSDEGIDSLVSETARSLLHLGKTLGIQLVSRELLLQGTVSTWSALEMLVGDELILLLDSKPHLVAKLLADPNGKKKFDLPKLDIDELLSRGFNLSNQMGHLLFGERDLSSLPTLKCACDALIENACLRERLASPSLWRLNQNRHLIVHRRGIVDEEYVRKTGSQLGVGEQITVSPSEFETQVREVAGIGDAFLDGLISVVTNA